MTRTLRCAWLVLVPALGAGCSLVLERPSFDARTEDNAALPDEFPAIDVGTASDALILDPDAALEDVAEGDVVVVEPADGGVAPTDGGVGPLWRPAESWSGDPEAEFTAVWAADNGQVWVGGRDSRMYAFDGVRWTRETLPARTLDGRTLRLWTRALWGTATDVWAACTVESPVMPIRGVVLRRRRSGDAWTAWATHSAPLNGIYVPTTGTGLVVGDSSWVYSFNTDLGGLLVGLVDAGRQPLRALGGRGGEQVWAVGAAGTVARFGTAVWPGHLAPPGIEGRGVVNDVFITDSGPFLGAVVSSAGTLALLDERTWYRFALGDGRSLRGVWVSRRGDALAVGDQGTIVRLVPTGSASIEHRGDYTLHDVFGTRADDAWAVGTGGTILHLRPGP